MTGYFKRNGILALVAAASWTLGSAVAVAEDGPTNFDAGKTPAQLFAYDCGLCHKSPQGLAKSGGVGLQSFLREHYTASKEAAAAIASYLVAVDQGKPAEPRERKKRSESKTKPADKKPDEKKSESKATDEKPSEEKKSEAASPAPKTTAKPAAKPETKPEAKPAGEEPK